MQRIILRICLSVFLVWSLADLASAEPGYVRKVENSNTAIVFVHGIFGNAREAWTSQKPSKAYFPDLVASDPQLANVDVYVYEYPTSLIGSTFSIDEISENMRLFFDADAVSSHQNLVFVAHSMGGLATRAYLLKNRDAAARTRMSFFFSTPTAGSEIAAIVSLALSHPQLSKMQPMKSDDYIADLQRNWLSADLKIASYCAYEKRATYGINIVTQASASNLCTKRLDPIDADHFSIVKPDSVRDVPYLAFKAAYTQSMGSATAAPSAGRLTAKDPSPSMRDDLSGLHMIGGGPYYAFVYVTIVNGDDRFRKLNLSQSMFDVPNASLVGNSVYARTSNCTGAAQEFRCLLILGFGGRRPASSDLLELGFGPLTAQHKIAEDTFKWESRRRDEDREPTYISFSEVRYEIAKIDWLVLSDAEILSGHDNQSLLRFTVTNATNHSKSMRRLSVTGAEFTGWMACAIGDIKAPSTVLKLDWQRIVSGLPSAAVVDLQGVSVPVDVIYNSRGTCSGYTLYASIPISETIEANSTRQIFVRISELPNEIRSVERPVSPRSTTPPARLSAWPYLAIELEGDAGEPILPTVMVLRKDNWWTPGFSAPMIKEQRSRQ